MSNDIKGIPSDFMHNGILKLILCTLMCLILTDYQGISILFFKYKENGKWNLKGSHDSLLSLTGYKVWKCSEVQLLMVTAVRYLQKSKFQWNLDLC